MLLDESIRWYNKVHVPNINISAYDMGLNTAAMVFSGKNLKTL